MIVMQFHRVLSKVVGCKLADWGLGTSHPYYVTFNTTYKCNSRCSTCGLWKVYANQPDLLKEELSLLEIDTMFSQVPEPLWLTLSGGEPLLRSDLKEICELAHDHYPNLYGLGLLTNGLLPERFTALIEDVLDIGFKSVKASVSIDGTKELNEKMRGVEGSYKKSLETYCLLKDLENKRKDFSVVVSRTVSPINAGTLHTFNKELLNDLYISIAQNGVAFDNLDYNLLMDKKPVLEDLNYLLKHASFEGIYKKLKKVFTKKCVSFIENPRMILPCSAFSVSCLIDPYGNIFPCTIWNRKVGSIRDHSFKEIWNSETSEFTRKMIKEKMCPICWSGCESTHTILQSFLSYHALQLLWEMLT